MQSGRGVGGKELPPAPCLLALGALPWIVNLSSQGLNKDRHCLGAAFLGNGASLQQPAGPPGWNKEGGKPVGREEQESEFKAHSKCGAGLPTSPHTPPTGSAPRASVMTKSSLLPRAWMMWAGAWGPAVGELQGKQVLEDQQAALWSMHSGTGLGPVPGPARAPGLLKATCHTSWARHVHSTLHVYNPGNGK